MAILSGFPYFNMKVVNMRGWQLHVGNSLFIIFVGLIFMLLDYLIKFAGLQSRATKFLKKHTKQIATGEGVDSSYAEQLLLD